MANLTWIWLLLLSVCQVVRGDGSARERWEKPDGKNPDNFKETYYLGDKIEIQWKGWNTTESKKFVDTDNDKPMAKLYVNAWNPDKSTWYDNLASMPSPALKYVLNNRLTIFGNSQSGHRLRRFT